MSEFVNVERTRDEDDIRLEMIKLTSERRLYERRLVQVNAALDALRTEQQDIDNERTRQSIAAYMAAKAQAEEAA